MYCAATKILGFRINYKDFTNFALLKKVFNILGSTGFDSEMNEMVSTSCNDIETRKRLGQTLNGENNYALAA